MRMRPDSSASIGTVLRTLRYLRPAQALAQLRHAVAPGVRPLAPPGPPALQRLETPKVPFLPNPPHAQWDGAGRFALVGQVAQMEPEHIDWDDPARDPLFSYQLHFAEYLRDPALAPGQRAALLFDWMARCRSGVGWDPHPLSVRTMTLGKLLLTPGALRLSQEERRRLLASLSEQIETLSHNLEIRLQANHLLHNLLAVNFGGLMLGGAAPTRWLRFGPQLLREIEEQVLPDGAHIERSPMYHSILLEAILDVVNLAKASGRDLPAGLLAPLQAAAARMLGALDLWTHPDGEIALFSDSAFGVAHPPAALHAYAQTLGVAMRPCAQPGVMDAAGFVRLSTGRFTLIASVGGPMPAYQPGHAHCDALSFELSVDRERVVTDTGVCEYQPGPRRQAARATRSHATVEVGGCDQAELWAAHRIGGRPRVAIESIAAGRAVEAHCIGWATPDTVHSRRIEVCGDGIDVIDRIRGRGRPLRFALPLAPGIEPELSNGAASSALLPIPGTSPLVRVQLPALGPGGAWRIERSPYFPRFGKECSRACLVGEAPDLLASGGDGARWRFEPA